MAFTSLSFPQGFPPAPPSQSAKAEDLILDLDLGVKIRIVKSTGLVGRQWIPWHCNAVAKIGPSAYLEVADTAKKGKEPKSLFSWLLKQELAG